MAKRKCTHDFTRLRFKDGSERQGLAMELSHGVVRDASCPAIPFRIDFLHSVKCDDCGAQLSLGESDETPVAVEIRAAELLEFTTHKRWKVVEEWGFNDHRDGGHEELSDDEQCSWHAGWLAREIRTHDSRETRDADAWPWDVTRPLAGQFEEWVAKGDALIAAMEEDAIANLIGEDDPRRPLSAEESAEIDGILAEPDPPPPADPTLQALAAEYLASDEGKAHTAQRAEVAAALTDDDPPTDPATKFGERAAQVVAPVYGEIINTFAHWGDDADDVSVPASDALQEWAKGNAVTVEEFEAGRAEEVIAEMTWSEDDNDNPPAPFDFDTSDEERAPLTAEDIDNALAKGRAEADACRMAMRGRNSR